MSEPQQPPVPPHGQVPPYGQPNPYSPAPAGQPYPQAPAAQPYPQSPQARPYAPQSPQAQPFAQQAPQYAQQGYPTADSPAYAPVRPPASGASLGRTALIIALITFGGGLLATSLFPLLYARIGFSYGLSFTIFNGIIGFLVLAGSITALILALKAIRRPGSPVLAGIAIGIAVSEIAATVFSWLSSLFYPFF
jgi:hypothetical protein